MAKKTTILIKVTEEEKNKIKENAEKAGMSVSGYLRHVSIYKEVK